MEGPGALPRHSDGAALRFGSLSLCGAPTAAWLLTEWRGSLEFAGGVALDLEGPQQTQEAAGPASLCLCLEG